MEDKTVITNNPYLPDVHIVGVPDPDDHPTSVAGCIASRHPLYKGMAYYGSIYSTDLSDDVNDAALRLIGQGIKVINVSWNSGGSPGQMDMNDRKLDLRTRVNRCSFTVAAGNRDVQFHFYFIGRGTVYTRNK